MTKPMPYSASHVRFIAYYYRTNWLLSANQKDNLPEKINEGNAKPAVNAVGALSSSPLSDRAPILLLSPFPEHTWEVIPSPDTNTGWGVVFLLKGGTTLWCYSWFRASWEIRLRLNFSWPHIFASFPPLPSRVSRSFLHCCWETLNTSQHKNPCLRLCFYGIAPKTEADERNKNYWFLKQMSACKYKGGQRKSDLSKINHCDITQEIVWWYGHSGTAALETHLCFWASFFLIWKWYLHHHVELMQAGITSGC